MIQHPFDRPGIALVFTSITNGTGKDTFVTTLNRIIGNHARHYTSETHFWDKHSTGKEGAILIHLEEACARANHAKSGELKALITSDIISVNPKGVKEYTVPNIARIIMTTNEANPIKLDETDRRFVICRPSNRLHAKGIAWWSKVYETIHTPAFLSTIGRYLANLDLTDWSPRDIPMTTIKKDLLELSKPTELCFLEDHCADSTEQWITPAELYSLYKTWYINEGLNPTYIAISPASLCMKLLAWKDTMLSKRTLNGRPLYKLNAISRISHV
jgi:putative DNA primase/helicase